MTILLNIGVNNYTVVLDRAIQQTIIYLIVAFFVINWYFAVLETLENPILSDNFGFSIEYNSYVFLATLIICNVTPIMM